MLEWREVKGEAMDASPSRTSWGSSEASSICLIISLSRLSRIAGDDGVWPAPAPVLLDLELQRHTEEVENEIESLNHTG